MRYVAVRARKLAGWLVLAAAVAVVVRLTEPDPEHGRSEDAEDADTERGYEHAPGDHDGYLGEVWDRHVDDAVALSLPSLPVREKEWHSVSCPCTICTTYQPHEIQNDWPFQPPRLYMVRDDDA